MESQRIATHRDTSRRVAARAMRADAAIALDDALDGDDALALDRRRAVRDRAREAATKTAIHGAAFDGDARARATTTTRRDDDDDARRRETSMDVQRAVLETLTAMQETQIRMNGKLAWISRSVPKIYDAVVNDVTTAIDDQSAKIEALTVRLARGASAGTTAVVGKGTRETREEAAADDDEGRRAREKRLSAPPSRSESPTARRQQTPARAPAATVNYGEIANEENEFAASLPRLGRVGPEGEASTAANTVSKFEKKKTLSPSSSMGKAEDPRKWSRQKWLSHLRATAPKLFGTLDDLSIGDMLDGSKCCFVRRGARVVRQGERGTSMFVVVLGKMHVVVTDAAKNRGEPLQVATMLAGDFFGEIALMTGEERRATVMAPYEGDGNVWVLEFSKSDVGSVILARPNVLRTLTDVCADRRLEKF